jgi:hypothetical protein
MVGREYTGTDTRYGREIIANIFGSQEDVATSSRGESNIDDILAQYMAIFV